MPSGSQLEWSRSPFGLTDPRYLSVGTGLLFDQCLSFSAMSSSALVQNFQSEHSFSKGFVQVPRRKISCVAWSSSRGTRCRRQVLTVPGSSEAQAPRWRTWKGCLMSLEQVQPQVHGGWTPCLPCPQMHQIPQGITCMLWQTVNLSRQSHRRSGWCRNVSAIVAVRKTWTLLGWASKERLSWFVFSSPQFRSQGGDRTNFIISCWIPN